MQRSPSPTISQKTYLKKPISVMHPPALISLAHPSLSLSFSGSHLPLSFSPHLHHAALTLSHHLQKNPSLLYQAQTHLSFDKHYTEGVELIDSVLDVVRKEAENLRKPRNHNRHPFTFQKF